MQSQAFWIAFGPILVIMVYFLASLPVFPFVYPKIHKVDFVEDRHSSKMLGKWVRHWWVWVTSPLYKIFITLKITPNQVSALGTFMGFLAALAFAFTGPWLSATSLTLGGWLMVFGASLDFMDGRLARETNQQSLAGAFFDSVMDRVSECLIFSAIAWYYRDSYVLWIVLAAFTGSMLTSYSKCRGDKMGVNYEGGAMQRPERIVYTGVGAIWAPFLGWGAVKFFPQYFSNWVEATNLIYALPLAFVAIMSNLTTVDRMRNIMRLLDEKEGKR